MSKIDLNPKERLIVRTSLEQDIRRYQNSMNRWQYDVRQIHSEAKREVFTIAIDRIRELIRKLK